MTPRSPKRKQVRKAEGAAEEQASPWKIVCAPATFDKLREAPNLHRILEVGRHVNALRYGMAALAAIAKDDSPHANRQRSATFFYFGGVLFEAYSLIPILRQHFGHLRAFKTTFGTFGSDEDIRARLARGGDLHTLRNHTSFHVLPMVAGKSLKTLNMLEYVLATGVGKTGIEVYYNLADTVPLHYAVGAPADGVQFRKEFERIAAETRDLAISFVAAGDKLIGAVAHSMGFVMSNDPVL